MFDLKSCGPDDVDRLRELSIRTFSDAFAAQNSAEDLAEYLGRAYEREKLRRELADEHSHFFFLCVDESLAGYLKLNEAPSQSDVNDPDSLEIERIYVCREFQGRRLG